MTSIVILSAMRTPIGAFQGALAAVPAPRLGGAAVRGALAQAGIASADVSDCLMGNVLQAGQGQAPARQAAIHGGLASSVRCVTVHKVCGSGLQAVMDAGHLLTAGDGKVAVAGGMENMSQAPYLLPKARDGYRLGHQQILDSLVNDGLWDPYNNMHMGECAEMCADKYSFSRERQDAYAIESFKRAISAQKDGRLTHEITAVDLTDAKGNAFRFEHDENPAKVKFEKIPILKPAFRKDGTITPANASSLNDGAAALVLTTAASAKARGLKPIARLAAFGAYAQEPVWFTTAPIKAAQAALKSAGWGVNDVDLWEVNEAFAVVPMAFMAELGVGHERVNVHGGAIALGHPLGCSGARMLVTLIAALRTYGRKRGVAAICIGGGEGLAVCVELI